ncbi:hypothetical protein JCM4814A_88810 [Streptomyces phaeofaciens JCM 4814]|uniref:Uncharacterized protein n=1 Tax=Streptomyces phaeofaciens TaxID=68254 RepID=A0A918HLR7_9ACTN|nr:hypothetical protein [Streptomyces phaeofaciens]GGT70099.1 hypothetical protein GCM10010226_54890 [Streptomyces phaeofaciens]
MTVWEACLWGVLGAGAVEALDLYGAIRRVQGYPWREKGHTPLGPYLLSVILRLGLGVGVAAAFGASGQAGGPVGVVAVGIAAPKILEQIARQGLPPIEQGQPPGGDPRTAVRREQAGRDTGGADAD